ncbi:FUSC family protein [Streptomyces rubiginosohelvolus]|uniref:FUSC family protein n=1 Tax=Streptomyces rubiginosohelvolus TaxID=67362 RepID=UPI0036CBEB8E
MAQEPRWSAAWRWLGLEWAEVWRSVRSAYEEAGTERDTLVQSLKAAGAAIAAWAVSGWWLQAPMALLAPWTAIAMVGSTVYQSVRTGIQQFAIIALGTIWASAAMVLTRDQTMAAMLLTLPFMMLLGNYRRFGSQGIYGATTALLVITAGVSSTSTVGHRLLETLIGAATALWSTRSFSRPSTCGAFALASSASRGRRPTLSAQRRQGFARRADWRIPRAGITRPADSPYRCRT